MASTNKRKGTYHEHWWVEFFKTFGWKAKRQPLSGLLPELPGDVKVEVNNTRLIVESKYQTNGKGWSFINRILKKKNQKYYRDILVLKQRSGEAYLCININNENALKILRKK